MNALKRLLQNTINLEVPKILVKVYKDSTVQDFIIDLNRIDQLFKKGEDSLGSELGQYGAFTESINQGEIFGFGGDSGTKKKVEGENIFLLDEGDFYRSFKVKIAKDGSFQIDANDIKDDVKLTEQYGKEILGLSAESKTKLACEILPEIIEVVRKEMFA